MLCAVVLALVGWGLFFFPPQTVQIKIDLPPATAPKSPAQAKPVNVFIDKDGALRVGATPSSLDTLTRDVAAQASTPDKHRQRVMIYAPDTVKTEDFVAVTKRLYDAGWPELGLTHDDPKEAP
jgi:biopolymer transport protein ExbD